MPAWSFSVIAWSRDMMFEVFNSTIVSIIDYLMVFLKMMMLYRIDLSQRVKYSSRTLCLYCCDCTVSVVTSMIRIIERGEL